MNSFASPFVGDCCYSYRWQEMPIGGMSFVKEWMVGCENSENGEKGGNGGNGGNGENGGNGRNGGNGINGTSVKLRSQI
jgi:hypothetical protein